MSRRAPRPRRTWPWLVGLWGVGMGAAAVAGVLVAMGDEAVAYSEQPPTLSDKLALVPAYPNTFLYPMGQALSVDGFGRDMAYGVTQDPPRKVADRYEAIWKSQGFRVERRRNGSEESVTATAPTDPYMRTVVATETADQTTSLVVSVRELLAAPHRPRMPLPRFCKVLSQTGGRDQGIDTDIVELVCEGYLRELLDFYDGALHGTERDEPLADQMGDVNRVVTYSGRELEVLLTASQAQLEPPRTSATVTWQERR